MEVVEGNVIVKYKSIKGYNVVKATTRKGEVTLDGFTKRGDLYIPNQYATGEWHMQTPHLEIVVKEGNIDLKLADKLKCKVYNIIQ